MTDEKFELSRRNALAALGAVGVASAGAGLGTSAYFSDEESFNNNTLAAGQLDLKVDWQQTYNGPNPGNDGTVEHHAVNAYPDTATEEVNGSMVGDGIQDLDGVTYSGAGEVEPVFDAADVPACCDCEDDEYYLTYGSESYCIQAIDGEESADDFYDYDSGEFASSNLDIQREDAAVLFLYEDADDELHLFIINNKLNNDREGNNGSVASFEIEGAEGMDWLVADWSTEDDVSPPARDDYEDADGSSAATADWAWDQQKTDGGVLGTLEEEFALRITPSLNDAATLDATSIFDSQTDVEQLMFLDGDTSTEVVLEDATGEDDDPLGALDSIVVHSSCGIDSGVELGDDVFQSVNYPEQEHLIEFDDVKPGDSGEITFSLHLCDNPGYIWIDAANFTQSGGELTEPEAVEINDSDGNITDVSNVGPGDDPGELAQNVHVTVWYDEDCDNEHGENEEEIFSGTLASLLDALNGTESELGKGLALNAGSEESSSECYPAGSGFCLGFEWEVPTDVGNIIQGDDLAFDLGFYTEQCRHNGDATETESTPTPTPTSTPDPS